MIDKFKTWALAAGIALTFSASFMIDGPSDHEAEQAIAASMADAQAQAQHVAGLVRECHRLRGPSAVLLQIRDTDNFVCREGAIEPTPVEIMQRYALLGSKQ